jgi:integrase
MLVLILHLQRPSRRPRPHCIASSKPTPTIAGSGTDRQPTSSAEPGPEVLVFPAPHGGYLRRSNFRRRWWVPATRAVGVQGLRVHDLRHSAATMALAAGANTRELMERMGHTSPAVALRYQHVMAGRDQAIAAALEELVQAAANLPPERPAEQPGGTLVARNRRARSEGPGRRATGGR